MIRKYKIIIFVCFIAIFGNILIKFFLIDEQIDKILALQKVVAAARLESNLNLDKPVQKISMERNDIIKIFSIIPEELSFTEYVVKIRSFIDKNNLIAEDRLVFKPEKTKRSDLLKYNTNIIVSGDYKKIKQLISDIQNMSGIVNLSSASIVKKKETRNMVTLKLKLSVFFKKRSV